MRKLNYYYEFIIVIYCDSIMSNVLTQYELLVKYYKKDNLPYII